MLVIFSGGQGSFQQEAHTQNSDQDQHDSWPRVRRHAELSVYFYHRVRSLVINTYEFLGSDKEFQSISRKCEREICVKIVARSNYL